MVYFLCASAFPTDGNSEGTGAPKEGPCDNHRCARVLLPLLRVSTDCADSCATFSGQRTRIALLRSVLKTCSNTFSKVQTIYHHLKEYCFTKSLNTFSHPSDTIAPLSTEFFWEGAKVEYKK